MRSSRLFPSLAVAAALAVAAVGCGGSSTSESAGDATTTIAASQSSETTAAAGTEASASSTTTAAGPAGSISLGSGGGEFCEKNREALRTTLGGESELGAAVLGAMADPAANREKLRKMITDARAQNKTIVDGAPSEIKSELQLILQASISVADALEKADYDMSKVDMAGAMATIDTPEFEAASAKVSAYLKDKCGIDVGM